MSLPGGGSVLMPEPYNRIPAYPTNAEKYGLGKDMLVAYRNWRSTLSGHPGCDGMITVGRSERFDSLQAFKNASRAGLSIDWLDADRIPGQVWDGKEKSYPVEAKTTVEGPELLQQLAVHRSGFFDVYDDPALMYVAGNRNGLHIAVWITDRQGGLRRALQRVSRIAISFER